MCGIVFVKNKRGENVAKDVIRRYENQKKRGSQGFGYVAVKNGEVVSYQRARYFSEIKSLLEKEDADEILFHHRNPTSTENLVGTAHPFFISHDSLKYNYYVVHNGVITNSYRLKNEHNNLGIPYLTEHCDISGVKFPLQPSFTELTYKNSKHNDSESLAIELALFMEGKKESIDADGASALIAYQVNKTTCKIEALIWGRNSGRPLVMETLSKKQRKKANKGKIKDILCLKSEGHGETVPVNALYVHDYEFNQTSYFVRNIGTYTETEKPKMGFQFSLPYKSNTETKPANKPIPIYTMSEDEISNEINYLDFKLGDKRAELEGVEMEFQSETDESLRVRLKLNILDLKKEIKDIGARIDDCYFYLDVDSVTS